MALGLASSYPAIARPSYEERFIESIELVMVNDNFLVTGRMKARSATEADSQGRPQEAIVGTKTIN